MVVGQIRILLQDDFIATDDHGCIENFIRLDLCESVANFFVLGLLSFFAFGNPYFDVVGIRVIKKPAEKTSRFMIQD